MKKFITRLATLSAALSALLYVRNQMPSGMFLWLPKLAAGALAPLNVLAGAATGLLGMAFRLPVPGLLGALSAFVSARYVRQMTAPHSQFSLAFGPDWESRLSERQKAGLLQQRWCWEMPYDPEPCYQGNLVFHTIPGKKERLLLCDLWTPPAGIQPSGLALIYLHGSAWYLLDKDFGTRRFFRHLAAQGHVVMDVGYRLFPEVDMAGMLADVYHAIAWMKAHAARFGASPEQVALAGGSAGGHLALLAAYLPANNDLIPPDLQGQDLSVQAVISEYGPADLIACYDHTRQDQTTRNQPAQTATSSLPGKVMRLLVKDYDRLGLSKGPQAGSLCKILGGHPDEIPEVYRRFSPVTYIHPHCPPTLLIQGEDDLIAPVEATRHLYQRLLECRVPVVNVILPQTDHAFDLLLPEISPAAQTALYDIDRFLALATAPGPMAGK